MTCRILEDGTFSCQQQTVRNLTLQHLATVHSPEDRKETTQEILRGLAQVAAAIFGRAGDRLVLYPDEPQLVTPLVARHDTHLVYQPSAQRFEAIHTPATENFGNLPDVFPGFSKIFPKLDVSVSNKLRELEIESRQPIPLRIHPGQAIFNPADFSDAGLGRKVISVSEDTLSQTPSEIVHDGTVLAKRPESHAVSSAKPASLTQTLARFLEPDLFSGTNLFTQNPFAQNSFGGAAPSAESRAVSRNPEDLQGYLHNIPAPPPPPSLPLPTPPSEELSYPLQTIITKVASQERLLDKELKDVLGLLQAVRATKNPEGIVFANQIRHQLALNISEGPNTMKSGDGYIIIGKQAYGTKEAFFKALEDLTYFEKNGEHLPPLYSTRSDLPQEQYIDVTDKVNKALDSILKEVPHNPSPTVFLEFAKKFGNDQKFDLQVNYGLPGQQLSKNILDLTKTDLNKSSIFITNDQYAIFRRQLTGDPIQDTIILKDNKNPIRRSGYISNYAYGYAMAADGVPLFVAISGAQTVSLKGSLKFDNPEDQKAIVDGWEDYTAKRKALINSEINKIKKQPRQ